MIDVENKGKTDEYVYDISLDGTVVNALGMNVLSNTDGFNFKMPDSFRYTESNPYISKGLGRNYEKGKAYTEIEADVAEFEDLYMNDNYVAEGGVNKMGLGIDEVVDATVNASRKNYLDLLDEETGEIKVVGNTLKSKKLPRYIERFLNDAFELLLYGKGKEFLDSYYDYVDDIYNLRIPLREIASVGRIKTSIKDYIENTKTYTTAGSKKARQAWYELAIKENVDVNMGDSIYYINTGKKTSDSDVKRITKYYLDGEDVTKKYTTEYNKVKRETDPRKKGDVESYEGKSVEWKKNDKGKYKCINLPKFVKKYYSKAKEVDEVLFNCVYVPTEFINSEEDTFCDDNFEYNVAKYIEQFNKRIKPLLVCFSKNIRTRIDENGNEVDNILITNPSDRKEFTTEEAKLTFGEPFKDGDQDTYEALMTMEDKEIAFWLSVNKKPLFVEECHMDWDSIVVDYKERLNKLKTKEVQEEREKVISTMLKLTNDDFEIFNFPESIWKIVDWDNKISGFRSKKWDVVIVTMDDLFDLKYNKEEYVDFEEDIEE